MSDREVDRGFSNVFEGLAPDGWPLIFPKGLLRTGRAGKAI